MRRQTNTRGPRGAVLVRLCAIALLLLHCTSEEQTATPAAVSPPPTPKPLAPLNVVLITLDTTRADALNPYGQARVTSPEIDRMAREGLVFEQVASSSPSTLPSHASILTGQFPFAHGARSNAGFTLAEANETLAEQLAARGYRTQAEIAASVLSRTTGLAQGFDAYHDLASEGIQKLTPTTGDGKDLAIQERGADDITRAGIQFLERNADRPFFLWLHYFDPHRLYVKRPRFEAEYRQDPYLAEVLFTDQQVGRIAHAIEDRGLRDRTLVVLTADHGEGRGEHGEASHAFLVYESTIRVPLVFWGATLVPKGRRVPSLVRTVDILPTVLELAGLPAPAEIHGRSLARAFRDEDFAADSLAYGESIEIASIFQGAPLRFVRQGDWKYVHQAEPLLYDLRSDPGELRNLAEAQPERAQALRESLEALVAGSDTLGLGVAPVDAERAAQLEALGYLNPARAADLAPRLASLDVAELRPEALLEDIAALERATGLTRAGKNGEARVLLEPLARRHPDSPTIQLELARALRDLGDASASRGAFEQTLRVSPCSDAARIEWAELLTASGEPGLAIEGLAKAVDTCPETVELLNHYAFVLATRPEAELRDGTASVRAAKRALALGGDSRPEILDTVAAAHAEIGDFEQAVEWSERSLRLAREQGRSRALLQLLERSLARFRKGQPLRSGS